MNKKNYLCIKKYAPPHHVFEIAFFLESKKRLVCQDWDIFSEKFDIFGNIAATHFILKTSWKLLPIDPNVHSRELNNKMNSIHDRALRNLYNDSKSIFEELLKKDNSASIHHRNL